MSTSGEKSREKLNILIHTVLSGVLMSVMIFLVFRFSIPNPNMILMTCMVLCAGLWGMIPGACAAILMLLYSMYFFSTDNSFIHYSEVNLYKILVIVIGGLGCYLIVGLLKRNRDRTQRELSETNENLQTMYQALEEKARADARLAELSKAVHDLLQHIPALTFSKDIATGKYLACNQFFAEYAHRVSPDKVVGLTDYDIFDEQTADHFVEDDQMALSMDEPYIFFEDVPDAVGNPRHFQTTKQKFYDAEGRLCTLGLCVDVTELINMKEQSKEIQKAFEQTRYEGIIYSYIAQSLSSDYNFIYYVDLETEEYVEYRADGKTGTISQVYRAKDFFVQARRSALTRLYEKDQSHFIASFTKENIERHLTEQGRFSLTYRLLDNGEPEYFSMKVMPLTDDKTHIVVGVKNIDAEMKARQAAARMKQERIAYARMNALSGDYIVVYTVDPESCSYTEYSANAGYSGLGLSTKGSNFFEESVRNAERVIYPEDYEKFRSLFTRENVLGELASNGIFGFKYRLMMDGKPVHVRLKAAFVEEDEVQRLIVGVMNIEKQVKQDQEYEYHLAVARTLANRDELTGVKNKHAYAELERELNAQIEDRKPLDFCLTICDVNELKSVNDNYGHKAGDEYLKQTSSIICDIFDHSPVFRIGGDEFAIISRGQDCRNIDSLLEALEESNRRNAENGSVVIAYGMARYSGEPSVGEVFEKADRLMYEKKRELKT